MQVIHCQSCGASMFVEQGGYSVCQYCGAKYVIQSSTPIISSSTVIYKTTTAHPVSSSIDLVDDVSRLLQKCKTDHRNARKYANLILDIDPDNKEALKYLC